MGDIVNLYETSFDPKKYAKIYYTENNGSKFLEWFPEFLHRLFSQGKLRGKTLLDVGSGPTLQGVMSASAYVQDIYLSDISKKTCDELRKWLRGDPDAIDQSGQLKYLAKLEGHNDYKQIEERIRKTVKDVLTCNVLKDNPLQPKKMKFDIIVSSLCAGVYPEKFFDIYKNISSLVRQGGYVILQESLNCSTYKVGNLDFPVYKKDASIVQNAVEEANIRILEVAEHTYTDEVTIPVDATGYVHIFGVKL